MSIRRPDIIYEALSIIDRGECMGRRYWGKPYSGMAGVPHINANRKKKAKRKQAQASRRKNRR